uniref:Coatomer subunit zeta n=1 Tax=Geospiza parvula TaxID=87175 RepID=A0A8U8CFG6_GEOPR
MEALVLEPSLYTVKAIIILDNDGERLFAKYYDDTYPSVKEQRAFEKNIFSKTHRSDSETSSARRTAVTVSDNGDTEGTGTRRTSSARRTAVTVSDNGDNGDTEGTMGTQNTFSKTHRSDSE